MRRFMSLYLSELESLFATAGTSLYGGEAISQREHALQAAWLAERRGHDRSLVAACLLHDVGHMLSGQGDDDLERGLDDAHERLAAVWLRVWLPDEVVLPVALHVQAKRYLCQSRPAYETALSEASRRSLALQGGAMDAPQASAFLELPGAADAIALRDCDDAAKVVGLHTPDLGHYLEIVADVARGREGAR
jgi:phosphonate degradation associated HDIG domain protein